MIFFRPGFFPLIAASFIFYGCDVSEGGGGGGGGQAPDPVVIDYPIAYIERPLPVDEDGEDLADELLAPDAFNPGARLILKERASVPAAKTVITDTIFAVEPTPDPDNPDAVLETVIPLYDVKDLQASPEGDKLIFAMRAPEREDADEDEQPTWNIWEYNLETEILRRIITSELIAEEGQDVSPAYLPDGRIVFSSNRQRRSRAILLDENKPQFSAYTESRDMEAFVLHVMDEDGTNIQQISYNQSHDLHPTVLSSGEIMFLRWDNYYTGEEIEEDVFTKNRLSLYKANPNGSNVSFVYGYHSQNTGTNDSRAILAHPREMSNGKILATLRARSSLQLGGNLVTIDVNNFTELNVPAEENNGAVGPAQTALSPSNIITTDESPSPDGNYNSAYPMDDGTGRIIMSWSQCFVEGYTLGIYVNEDRELIGDSGQYVSRNGDTLSSSDNAIVISEEDVGIFPCTEDNIHITDIQIARPRYGLWVYDPSTDTQSPVVLAQEDKMATEPVVLEPRTLPEFISDPVPGVDFDSSLDEENVGIVHIRSVYDIDGTDIAPGGLTTLSDPSQTPASQRPARFIRLIKAVSMADEDVVDFDSSAFGEAGAQMKEILGYIPIEPDGSAKFKVPADVAFTFSIVDSTGKRVVADGSGEVGPRHENWLSVRAGETLECRGCHAGPDSEVPHGRIGVGPESINLGALSTMAFPGTSLRDEFGIEHTAPPEIGETMAEYYARMNAPRTPSMNMVDYDDWSDDGVRPRTPAVSLSFSDIGTTAPTSCISEWNSLCRTTINYIDHIQPIWSAQRLVTDPNDSSVVLQNNTCTQCHSTVVDGVQQVPAGELQLDLSDTQSSVNADYLTSYSDLFYRSNELIIGENGELLIRLEQQVIRGVPQFEMIQLVVDGIAQYQAQNTDGNIVPAPRDTTDPNLTLLLDNDGNPVPYEVQLLDAEGNPVPVLVPVRIGPIMNPDGAVENTMFFDLFENFDGTVDHRTFLNSAELKLIAEWLDIGGQYYNNPFDAPE